MEIVKFDDKKHYEQLRVFWSQYDWKAPELDCLPRTGFVAEHEGKTIGACFYYKSNSKMCFMDWMIADKEADSHIRRLAVLQLIGVIKNTAKDAGIKVIYTVTGNLKLVETYKQLGFQIMEQNAVTMAHSTAQDLDFLRD